MADKRKVRTTMRPDVEIEVSGPEHLDLSRQGLLLPDEPPAPAPAPVPAEAPAANTTKGAK